MKRGLLVAFTYALTLAMALTALAKSPAPKPAPWSKKMRQLEQTLQALLIDLSSDDRFNAPSNKHRIARNAERFAKLAHNLTASAPPAGSFLESDPSIQIVAGQFAREADHAVRALKDGHRDYGRGLLRSMTDYCIACHTRNGGGPSFALEPDAPALKALEMIDRADYLSSVRQFDAALQEYERLINDSRYAQSRPFDWERAVRSALALAVRVKKDPTRALGIVERVIAEPAAPYFFKEYALQWKKSALSWKAEAPAKAQTEEGHYSQVIRLIADAKSLQKYPADRSADVLYLRASAAAHDLLGFARSGTYTAQGLYLAGLCYEVLRNSDRREVHELYYLACIAKAPHTDTSRQCYRHYEESVYVGYSGSAGLDLPNELRAKLRELEKLSTPAVETSPEVKKLQ